MALPALFLDRARALVGANTVSDQGTRKAVEILRPLYEEAGLPVQTLGESEDQSSVLAGPGGGFAANLGSAGAGFAGPPAVKGGVLFVTHLDTVPSGPSERWTETGGDAWALTEKDGWLFGLGCADVKLDALCKIEAAKRLRGVKLRRPFWLLGTFGEEVGLRGARHFVQSEVFRTIAPTQVLCGEPSELAVIHAHKGYVVVRCVVTDRKARLVSLQNLGPEELTWAGKAAHSSTPHLGVNAIGKALQWSKASGTPVVGASGGAASNVVPAKCTLQVPAPRDEGRPAPDAARLLPPTSELRPNLWRALASAGALGELWLSTLASLEPKADGRFEPAGAVGGLNVLESGSGPPDERNIYADGWVAVTLDGRLLPQHDPDALIAKFQGAAQQWIADLGRGDLTLSISVERNAGGMALPDHSPLVEAAGRVLRAHGLDGTPRAKPTSTEGGIFHRAGCEAIVFGPGVSTGNAHTANERIEKLQLERAIELYEALLIELCQRGP